MNIMDFSKKRDLNISFINTKGKKCNYDMVITAMTNDLIRKVREARQLQMSSLILGKQKIQLENMSSDGFVNEALSNVTLDEILGIADDSALKKDVVKSVLHDQYDTLLEDCDYVDTDNQGILEPVVNVFYDHIINELEKLEEDINSEEGK